jgi:hypothetical protein
MELVVLLGQPSGITGVLSVMIARQELTIARRKMLAARTEFEDYSNLTNGNHDPDIFLALLNTMQDLTDEYFCLLNEYQDQKFRQVTKSVN